ncbi:hypothetical protein FPV67DRAFT_1669098 [Lyophyllum atratum]|nr:hypothetical protein FPV67DRAFT_1669098 [Lyophyllum atratum]
MSPCTSATAAASLRPLPAHPPHARRLPQNRRTPSHPQLNPRSYTHVTHCSTLAQSPLARLPMELRDSLRGDVPEIITNRKQRKAIEYHNQLVQNTAVSHRSRPSVRAPTERRRRNTPQVVDHVGWRGMRPIVTPITV